MWRYLAGAVAALLMVAAGMALFSGRARNEALLPAMPQSSQQQDDAPALALPDSVPAATAKTASSGASAATTRTRTGA